MYCKYCGNEIGPNQMFCAKCGSSVDEMRSSIDLDDYAPTTNEARGDANPGYAPVTGGVYGDVNASGYSPATGESEASGYANGMSGSDFNPMPTAMPAQMPASVPAAKKKPNKVLIAVVAVVVVVAVVLVHDGQVQSQRDDFLETVAQYESAVDAADEILRDSEEEAIDLSVLEDIAAAQEEVVQSSQTLINLDPETYEGVLTYNSTVEVYAAQMSALNKIINGANKTYASIKYEKPQNLDAPPAGKKILEMLGIAQVPELGVSEEAFRVAGTLDERYEAQTELRESWNARAKEINETQRTINDMRDTIYDLYGTDDPTGTHVEVGEMLTE